MNTEPLKYPVVYFQLKLILRIWQKSKDENKEMMIKEIKNSIKEIEKGMMYEDVV